jgi:hypothetical protein
VSRSPLSTEVSEPGGDTVYSTTLQFLRLGYLSACVCVGLLGILAWPVSLLFLVLAVGFRVRKQMLTTLGSARWASEQDLSRAGMLDADRGLILGRLQEPGSRSQA